MQTKVDHNMVFVHFLKSFRDYRNSWRESWKHLVEIDNSKYLRKILSSIKDSLTLLYEDNTACITLIRGGYIKGGRLKQIQSSNNLTDLFTKSLLTATIKKIVHNINMCQLKNLFITYNWRSTLMGSSKCFEDIYVMIVLFFLC